MSFICLSISHPIIQTIDTRQACARTPCWRCHVFGNPKDTKQNERKHSDTTAKMASTIATTAVPTGDTDTSVIDDDGERRQRQRRRKRFYRCLLSVLSTFLVWIVRFVILWILFYILIGGTSWGKHFLSNQLVPVIFGSHIDKKAAVPMVMLTIPIWLASTCSALFFVIQAYDRRRNNNHNNNNNETENDIRQHPRNHNYKNIESGDGNDDDDDDKNGCDGPNTGRSNFCCCISNCCIQRRTYQQTRRKRTIRRICTIFGLIIPCIYYIISYTRRSSTGFLSVISFDDDDDMKKLKQLANAGGMMSIIIISFLLIPVTPMGQLSSMNIFPSSLSWPRSRSRSSSSSATSSSSSSWYSTHIHPIQLLHIWTGRLIIFGGILHGTIYLCRWMSRMGPVPAASTNDAVDDNVIDHGPSFYDVLNHMFHMIWPPMSCWTGKAGNIEANIRVYEPPDDWCPPSTTKKHDGDCDSCKDLFRNLTGFMAYIGLISLGLSSLGIIRRRYYNTVFYRLHIIIGPLTIVMIILHYKAAVLYAAGGLIYYLSIKSAQWFEPVPTTSSPTSTQSSATTTAATTAATTTATKGASNSTIVSSCLSCRSKRNTPISIVSVAPLTNFPPQNFESWTDITQRQQRGQQRKRRRRRRYSDRQAQQQQQMKKAKNERPCISLTFEASDLAVQTFRPGMFGYLRYQSSRGKKKSSKQTTFFSTIRSVLSSLTPSSSSAEVHPFTINLVPNQPHQIRIITRVVGRFTKELYSELFDTAQTTIQQYDNEQQHLLPPMQQDIGTSSRTATIEPGIATTTTSSAAGTKTMSDLPNFYIQGYYQGTDFYRHLQYHQVAVFIAAGIGITPYLTLFTELIRSGKNSHDEDDDHDDDHHHPKRIVFHWICRDQPLIDYVQSEYFDYWIPQSVSSENDTRNVCNIHGATTTGESFQDEMTDTYRSSSFSSDSSDTTTTTTTTIEVHIHNTSPDSHHSKQDDDDDDDDEEDEAEAGAGGATNYRRRDSDSYHSSGSGSGSNIQDYGSVSSDRSRSIEMVPVSNIHNNNKKNSNNSMDDNQDPATPVDDIIGSNGGITVGSAGTSVSSSSSSSGLSSSSSTSSLLSLIPQLLLLYPQQDQQTMTVPFSPTSYGGTTGAILKTGRHTTTARRRGTTRTRTRTTTTTTTSTSSSDLEKSDILYNDSCRMFIIFFVVGGLANILLFFCYTTFHAKEYILGRFYTLVIVCFFVLFMIFLLVRVLFVVSLPPKMISVQQQSRFEFVDDNHDDVDEDDDEDDDIETQQQEQQQHYSDEEEGGKKSISIMKQTKPAVVVRWHYYNYYHDDHSPQQNEHSTTTTSSTTITLNDNDNNNEQQEHQDLEQQQEHQGQEQQHQEECRRKDKKRRPTIEELIQPCYSCDEANSSCTTTVPATATATATATTTTIAAALFVCAPSTLVQELYHVIEQKKKKKKRSCTNCCNTTTSTTATPAPTTTTTQSLSSSYNNVLPIINIFEEEFCI